MSVHTRTRRRSIFSIRDLFDEAAFGVASRPGRLILTTLGTVLGVGSIVVTLGIGNTASGQIGAQFDAVAATQVIVKPNDNTTFGGTRKPVAVLPWDAVSRVDDLAGVEAAAAIADIDTSEKITAVPLNDPSLPEVTGISLTASTPELLQAVRGRLLTGRFFDAGHDDRADRVAVLGAEAANKLGIARLDSQPSIFIGDTPYAVIGIVDDVARRPDLVGSVIIPMGTARHDFDIAAPSELQIRIDVGAGESVKHQAPIALDPNLPDGFRADGPSASSRVKDGIAGDLLMIFIALGAVALLVGGVGIANITLLSVRERVGEIGLRRALGATKGNIAGQFIVESLIIGLLGGLIGSALGVLVVLGVSLFNDWTPILDVSLSLGMALLGGIIGLLAGLYPALKAASTEPIIALRAGP